MIQIPIGDIFDFSNEVKENVHKILPVNIKDYVTFHLRLGDKYLETDPSFVNCKNDTRVFNEERLYDCIEQNSHKNIIFFCDNQSYKMKVKYNQIIITNSNIGHTSLLNTTNIQILDTITEFYIITQSNMIYSISNSGFSSVGAKFKNIPFIKLY